MRETDNMQLILLNVGESAHNGDWNWKNISSPFTRLFYVKEGKATVNLPDGARELRPRCLYLIPPFTPHSYECEGYFAHYYIHIYEKQSSTTKALEDMNFPFEVEANESDLFLVERLMEINHGRELKQFDPQTYDNQPTLLRDIATEAHQPEYAVLETKGILLQLLSRFVRFSTYKYEVSDERIVKVLKYIRKNIDKPIKISDLSEIASLSNDHFIRLFKASMQCTPIDYVNQKKIEKAQLMLLLKNVQVKDIAYGLSFENLSYFSYLFKKLTCYTPCQYRKMFN
ncbi:MAG: AraC family transcriptional regulator [Prevotellaceae bacterium]|jgi:AraC-like DNA-binding protein/mannose-6-phosphate isomerase-like protein (cupin superfamily)|nr:AraC family transcriptional regulator [Prevotellaceae bacterium]